MVLKKIIERSENIEEVENEGENLENQKNFREVQKQIAHIDRIQQYESQLKCFQNKFTCHRETKELFLKKTQTKKDPKSPDEMHKLIKKCLKMMQTVYSGT